MVSGFVLNTGSDTAGVDEAGRGPLAGPVVAAAVVLSGNEGEQLAGLKDSKILAPQVRTVLAAKIKRHALCWSIAAASSAEIDELNILQASLLAMRRAVEGLARPVAKVLVDGTQLPRLACAAEAVVKGDSKVDSIAAASILAKVARDEMMTQLDEQHPAYGFARHKGYPTKAHLAALEQHGALPIHRRSFAPVRRLVGGY